jgi:hypothetical protein
VRRVAANPLWFDSTAEKTTFCLDVPRY